MRTKKALINASVNILAYLMYFIPNLIIRKIFLNTLGNDILGLNSLYTNIISWLSIVELGVSSAIVYSLYKPYADDDKKQVRAYIRFYGKFYRSIGFIILTAGIMISPFLSYFIKGKVDIKLATIGFLLFLINTFISYMFSHKLCILNVAQEIYRITIGTAITKISIIIFQIFMLKIYPSFILFILIQIIINFIYFIIINSYVNNRFPWINQGEENLEPNVKKSLLKNIKSLFMHKIGGLVVTSTDNIIISKFIGLEVLAKYTNYEVVILAFRGIVNTALDGITATLGNIISTDSKDKAYDVHKKVFFLNFWCVSFIIISLYNILNQFIGIWFGKKYILDNSTFIVILINLYFSSMRGSIEQFKSSSGNFYQDRYAPIFESIINLVTSIVLVNYIGLVGVFIGTLISNITVIFTTKPYIVYKYVFNKSLKEYYKMYFKYLFIGILPLVITSYFSNIVKYNYTILSLLINCLINMVIINLIYLIIFCKTDEFKYYRSIFKNIINKEA